MFFLYLLYSTLTTTNNLLKQKYYDTLRPTNNRSGQIEEDEMTTLIETLQQGEAYSNTKQALLGAFDEDGDGKMNFEEFIKLNEKFPQMLRKLIFY